MAILRMESFDYTTNISDVTNYSWFYSSSMIENTVPRTGPNSLVLKGGPFHHTSVRAFEVGQQTTVWAQCAWRKTNSWPNDYPYNDQEFFVLGFWEGNGTRPHVNVGFSATGGLVACRGTSTIASSSATGLYNLNEWYFIEAKVVISDTVGSVLVKLNGTTHINQGGLDTRNGGSGFVQFVAVGIQDSTGDGFGLDRGYIDDLIIGNGSGDANTSPPGDARVEYMVPIGAGSRTQFTPLSGTNWSNVDESGSVNDSDYNTSPDTGATDFFAMSNFPTNGLVHGLQSVIRCRKDDAGYRLVRPALCWPVGQGETMRVHGGIDAGVGDTFSYKRTVFNTSPDTNAAWTIEELDDLQYGYTVGGGNEFTVDAWTVAF